MESVAAAANEAGVKVITGDTKVVGRGQADGMYITTAGVGLCRRPQLHRRSGRAGRCAHHQRPHRRPRPGGDAGAGDAAGADADQERCGAAERADRAGAGIGRAGRVHARSDARRAWRAWRPTWRSAAGLHVVLDESAIPVRPETRHAAEMLGLDPLEVANEGKVVMVVAARGCRAGAGGDAAASAGQAKRAIIGQIDGASGRHLRAAHGASAAGGSCRSRMESSCRGSAEASEQSRNVEGAGRACERSCSRLMVDGEGSRACGDCPRGDQTVESA